MPKTELLARGQGSVSRVKAQAVAIKGMLFSPLPPPVGGVASITAMLHRELGGNPEVLFLQPLRKTTSWTRVVRPLVNIVRLIRGTVRVQAGGRVVFFCSSRSSFWEKCVWAAFVLVLGRSAVMVMVAGDFPVAFAEAPRPARAAAHWLFRRRRLVVAAQSKSWAAVYRGIFREANMMEVGATVDAEFFLERKATAAPVVNILYVGWIVESKGVVDLLDALGSVKTALDARARLKLVGPLFGRDSFWRTEIDKRGLGSIVEVTGAVTTRTGIREYYQKADVFVFPSHFEGFPVALLEATAAGLACVATDVGGIADILDGGRAGLLIPPHAPCELAAALVSVVDDAALRARLGEAASRHTRRRFSREAFVNSYECVLGVRQPC